MLEGVNSHELYDLGHLYEAAVAHYQATGKRTLLDIALRTANLLDQTFGPGKRSIWPGHQIVEMGLAKLYRATGDVRYLNLAKFMLDARGPDSQEQGAGNRYVQAHQKVVDQTDAVAGGHAVRAMYMYSGMADVAALTGDMAYVAALDRIWENVASRKLHVTGGVGARAAGEAFGDDYELPNLSAYNETVLKWEELCVLPMHWKSALSQWRGIYYIFDTSDGKGYVGSAYGDSKNGPSNMLGRWLNYAASGQGGNALLRNRVPSHFRFSIIQRVSPDMDVNDVIRLEGTWKDRLHTRAPQGLNDN